MQVHIAVTISVTEIVSTLRQTTTNVDANITPVVAAAATTIPRTIILVALLR